MANNEDKPISTRLKAKNTTTNTIKAMEAKDEAQRNKKNEAQHNKELKDNKRDDKKDNEKLIRTTIAEMSKDNAENKVEAENKMNTINDNIKQMREEMKTTLTEVATTIAEALKNGINQMTKAQTNNKPNINEKLIQQIENLENKLNENNTHNTDKDTRQQQKVEPQTPHHNKTQPRLSNIYEQITKEELIKTINELINRVNRIEENLNIKQKNTEKTPQEKEKPKEYLPVINLDENDEPQINDDLHEKQPLDFTLVKTARKMRPERPKIPEQVAKTVNKDIKQHIKQQQQQCAQTTPKRQQEDIDTETKNEKIKNMLKKQTLTIGFAPITNQHLQNIEKTMLERGVLNVKQPWEERKKGPSNRLSKTGR